MGYGQWVGLIDVALVVLDGVVQGALGCPQVDGGVAQAEELDHTYLKHAAGISQDHHLGDEAVIELHRGADGTPHAQGVPTHFIVCSGPQAPECCAEGALLPRTPGPAAQEKSSSFTQAKDSAC